MMTTSSAHTPYCRQAATSIIVFLSWLAFASQAFAEDSSQSQQHYDISLGKLLDGNGHVVLPEGFSGSIDPAGYQMVSQGREAPQFVPSSASDGAWSQGEFPIRGCSGIVEAAAVINQELFLGLRSSFCGFPSISNIARIDPTTGEFEALGDGVNNSVRALTAIGDDLYVGGNFTQAGGEPANRIAVFDTTQTGNAGWSALGDGVNSTVWALAAIGDDLYVGGNFTQAGGEPANLIAVFDTTQTNNAGWSALGDGVSNTVLALAAIGDDLYVGGAFEFGGFFDGRANHIQVYDTTRTGDAGWSALGDGVSSTVRALTAIGDDLYVGGDFIQAGGEPALHIAVYDTTETGNAGWSALGVGPDSKVRALTAIGDKLYVGGGFTRAGSRDINRVAVYDTTQSGNAGWSALGNSFADGVNKNVFALAAIGDDLYVGGDFTQAGGFAPASRIAVFDTTQTSNAGWSGLGAGVNNRVRALAAIREELYVGGKFIHVGGADADRIAVFDTNQTGNAGWSAFGNGLGAPIYALAAIGDNLYAGGFFKESFGAPANRIAVFDTTQTGDAGWSALGDGVSFSVYGLAAIGDDLYVGGSLNEAGGQPANRIAVFDTTQTGNAGWSALGDGVNSTPWALAAIGNDLYVGGGFTQAGGAPANHIAVFDTTQSGNAGWSALGDGVNSTVWALAAIGDDLYVGGDFTQAGGESASRMVAFDTTESGNSGWSPLGDGVDSTVRALAAMGNDLYVGGDFTQAGGEPANHIAVFDTAQTDNTGWSALGDGITAIDDGVTSSVWTLAAVGDELYIGGEFTQAGGNVNGFFARYDTNPNSPPLAQSDDVATDEDTPLPGNVLADNGSGPDTDPDGDPLTVIEVNGVAADVDTQITLVSGALLTVNNDGSFDYDPNGQFESLGSGDSIVDSFDYTISDGQATSSATVTITINAVNDPPEAIGATAKTDPNTPVAITLTGSDIDGDALTFAIATSPTNGSLSALMPINNTSAKVTYAPDAGFDGSDSFTFTASDGTVDSSEATIVVMVGIFADSFEQD